MKINTNKMLHSIGIGKKDTFFKNIYKEDEMICIGKAYVDTQKDLYVVLNENVEYEDGVFKEKKMNKE